jgi:hypothetical protein
MTEYQLNMRVVKFIHEDVLLLYARFGYDEFVKSETRDLPLYYSLKKLLNEAAITRIKRSEGRSIYKLTRYVVEKCEEFRDRHV